MIENFVEKSFEILDQNERVFKAIGLFRTRKVDAILVFDRDKYKGILTEEKLIRLKIDLNEKIKKYITKVKPINLKVSIHDVAKKMIENNIRTIPVFEGEWHIISAKGILKAIENLEISKYKVEDLMTENVITINSWESISKAVTLMRKYNISRLPVLEKGKLVGIVTIRDIVERVIYPREKIKVGELGGEAYTPLSASVSSIMSKDVIAVKPEDTIGKLAKIFLKNNISGCPVLEDGKLIGIITVKDILLELAKEEKVNINISTSGIELDELDKEWIKEKIENKILRKYKSILGEYANFHIHIRKIKETQEKTNIMRFYSVRIKVISEKGRYFASDYGWELYNALLNCLESLETELRKKKEKIQEREVYKELFEGIEIL